MLLGQSFIEVSTYLYAVIFQKKGGAKN